MELFSGPQPLVYYGLGRAFFTSGGVVISPQKRPKYLNWSHPYTLEAWRSVILHISIAMSDFGSAGSLRLKRRMWLTEYSGRCSVINQAWLSTYKFWGSKKDFQLYLAKLNDQISDYKKKMQKEFWLITSIIIQDLVAIKLNLKLFPGKPNATCVEVLPFHWLLSPRLFHLTSANLQLSKFPPGVWLSADWGPRRNTVMIFY